MEEYGTQDFGSPSLPHDIMKTDNSSKQDNDAEQPHRELMDCQIIPRKSQTRISHLFTTITNPYLWKHLSWKWLALLTCCTFFLRMYLERTMSPLEPDNEGKYKVIGFHETTWREIVNGNEDVTLNFHPFYVTGEGEKLVAELFVSRIRNYFLFFGGLQSEAASKEPLTVRLQMRIEFTIVNGERIVEEIDLLLDLESQLQDKKYLKLFTMFDVPWNELSASSAPLVTLLHIRPKRSPLNKFHLNGLVPRLSKNNDFGYIDWSSVEGAHVSNKREWMNIVGGNENAQLLFPPLVLPANVIASNYVVVTMFAVRNGNSLVFYGGFHTNVDKSVNECNLIVTLDLKFHRQNGQLVHRTITQSVTFNHKGVGGYSPIFYFTAMPWNHLEPAKPPVATRVLFKASHLPHYLIISSQSASE